MLPPAYPRTKIVLSNGLPPAYGETAPFAALPLAYGDAGVEFLFSDNDAGFWSDLSRTELTFQDTGGATPSDAVSEPIGLVRGAVGALTLTQGTAASKLTRGRAPYGGIKNRVLMSNKIATSPWVRNRMNLPVEGSLVDADGSFTLCTADGSAGGSMSMYQDLTAAANSVWQIQVKAKPGTATWLQLNLFDGVSTSTRWANLTTGTAGVTTTGSGIANFTVTPMSVSGAFIRAQYTVGGTGNLVRLQLVQGTADGTLSTSATRTFYLGYADARVAAAQGTYQETTFSYDVTESGATSIPTAYADAGDIWSFGAASFGTAANGLYAAAGNNWSATAVFAGFGAGSLLAQTEQATEADRMFDLLVNASGALDINIRGAVTTLKAGVNDGNYHSAQIICTNGVITVSVDGAAATTPTVGTAASEAVQITVAGRNNTTPTNRYTGHILPPMLIDRALSAGERAAEFAYYDSLLKIP